MRKLIFHLHLYLGLTLGLLVSLTGLTGSLLVFRHEIDSALHPALFHATAAAGQRVSSQTVLETVRAAHPEEPVQQLLAPRDGHPMYGAWLEGGRLVLVDPGTGAIRGSLREEESPMGFLFSLHRRLLSGEQGETAVGIGGIALLLMGVSGVVLWWPGKQGWRDGFTVRWKASWKRVTWDLHRVTGAATVLLMFLIALTGVMLVFGAFFTDAIHSLTRTRAPAKAASTIIPGRDPLPLDELVSRANAALPGGEISRITIPAKATAAFTLRKKLPGELHPNGMSFVYLDQFTGTVLRTQDARRATLGPQILNLRYPLHIGSYGGLAVRLLYALAGLCPGFLFTTGCLLWVNRTRKRRRADRHAAARQPVPACEPEKVPS